MKVSNIFWITIVVVVTRGFALGHRGEVKFSTPMFECVSAQDTGDNSASKVHTPAAGSAERKAIMDALRGDQKVVFKVYYLKVHGDWAWVDTTPLDKKGKAVAEGGANLVHKENSAWNVVDLSVIPEDPDNPMGPDDPDPKFVKAVQKAFPGVPADIFPPRKRSK